MTSDEVPDCAIYSRPVVPDPFASTKCTTPTMLAPVVHFDKMDTKKLHVQYYHFISFYNLSLTIYSMNNLVLSQVYNNLLDT